MAFRLGLVGYRLYGIDYVVYASDTEDWTVVAPFLCAAALIVLTVLKFISFLQVCNGKAVEPAIVRSMKFLR